VNLKCYKEGQYPTDIPVRIENSKNSKKPNSLYSYLVMKHFGDN